MHPFKKQTQMCMNTCKECKTAEEEQEEKMLDKKDRKE
jgi:hypothetical protein